MVQKTFSVYGKGCVLTTGVIYPPIKLDHINYHYSLGLIGLYTSHSVQNIFPGKNKFYFGTQEIEIASGSYELDEIYEYIKAKLKVPANNNNNNKLVDGLLKIKANTNTGKCEIYAEKEIDFTKNDSIASLLGFSQRKLKAKENHVSDRDIDIISTPNIFVDTNITTGAYRNNRLCHSIYEFGINVPPGYIIEKEVSHPIYFDVTVGEIDNITIRLVDFQGNLVNFSPDTYTSVRLELKQEPLPIINGFKL